MPGPEKARIVGITLSEKGLMKEITDEKKPHVLPERQSKLPKDHELPLDGEQYEWNLSKYFDTGIPITHFFATYLAVAANATNPYHRNTAKLNVPELIKLDCGHWGGYKRWREFDGEAGGPQREFGLIEGSNVWLCEYVVSSNAATITRDAVQEFAGKGAVLARELAEVVGKPGLGAIRPKIYAHATAAQLMTDRQVKQSLYLGFPDLHLPERWPELPTPAERYGGDDPNSGQKKARLKLQQRLRDCQRVPGNIAGNTLSATQMQRIQDYLELIQPYVQARELNRDAPEPADQFTFHTRTITQKTHNFTARQFLAEKDLVDREIRLRSTWFYGRGPNYAKEAGFGSDDIFAKIVENGNGVGTPGQDLVNFLCAIRQLREDLSNNRNQRINTINARTTTPYTDRHVKVVQLGDIYEAWLNREFLYRGFWVRQTNAGKQIPYFAINCGATGTANPVKDDYQFRIDEENFSPKARARLHAKYYMYNHVPKKQMFYRHVVGDMVEPAYVANEAELERIFHLPEGEFRRRQDLLKARVDRVKAFSLPIEQDFAHKLNLLFQERQPNYLAQFYQNSFGPLEQVQVRADDPVARHLGITGNRYKFRNPPPGYVRNNANGYQEILWHKVILDLFQNLDYRCVYGNHDGYRGDPLLNKALVSPRDKCPGWLSDSGVWFEHSHRWDEFNRDGCAFGAGAANLVYYYFNNLCSKSSGKTEAEFAKQEQACFQPGAALWFLLANFGKQLPWFRDQAGISAPANMGDGTTQSVQPFAIYVSGHTHSGDLIRIQFSLEKKAQKKRAAEKEEGEVKVKRVGERQASAQASDYNQQFAEGDSATQLHWLKTRS